MNKGMFPTRHFAPVPKGDYDHAGLFEEKNGRKHARIKKKEQKSN